MAHRVQEWRTFGLDWWLDHLLPILDQFVAASKGEVDREFWQSLFNNYNMCGQECFEGWITSLFPYITREPDGSGRRPVSRNEAFDYQGAGRLAFSEQNFAFGPGRVPFMWEYLGRRIDMELIGGLVGVRQDTDTGALSPEVGWAVRRV